MAVVGDAAPLVAAAGPAAARARRGRASAVGAFGTVAGARRLVYYRFFGDVLSAPAMLGARQTGHVWESIRSLFSPACSG